jgi:hypothetical protein
MEITREDLYKLIWKEPVTKVAEKMGVPAPILRKFCYRLNIPTPSSGYWSKLQFGKPVEIPPLPAFEDKEIPSLDSFQKPKKKKVRENVQKESAKEIEIPSNEETTKIPSISNEYKQEMAYIIEEPQDPRKKVQYELKKMDQAVFVVPEILYAKNPLIIDTKEYFRGDKNAKYLDKNPYKSKIQSPLNIHVQPENQDRALRIFSTIIRVLELRGHHVVAKDVYNTIVMVNEEEIPIQLYEKNKQIPNTESSYPSYLTVPSGRFKFEIPRKRLFYYNSVCVEDTPTTKLEEKIINIIAKIEIEAISIKEDREEQERLRKQQEEERKRRELEEQKKRELAKKRDKEKTELKAAFLSAECYSWANILRAYVEKYESFLSEKETINDEDKEKLHWLKKKIEWLDPFIECDDELLAEEDKQSLIHPEIDMKDNRAIYHSYSEMPSEFTFWNNPFRRRN